MARLGIEGKSEAAIGKKESGLFSFNNKDVFIIIDGGSIGPDHIPAHSHGDTFTYELSFKGKKFIIDSGVYEYTAGEMRDYSRSTRAHNTVTIDSISQAEMWGGFRVARRYYPENLKYEENDSSFVFEGKFYGYAKLIGDNLIHKRNIEIEKNSLQITVTDEITGSGNHLVESFIHLHPDVEINKFDGCLVLSLDKYLI